MATRKVGTQRGVAIRTGTSAKPSTTPVQQPTKVVSQRAGVSTRAEAIQAGPSPKPAVSPIQVTPPPAPVAKPREEAIQAGPSPVRADVRGETLRPREIQPREEVRREEIRQIQPQPEIIKTTIRQDERGAVTHTTEELVDGKKVIASSYHPPLIEEIKPEPQKLSVPLQPTTAGLLGGVALFQGATPTAPLQPTQAEKEFMPSVLEGYKIPETEGVKKALDITPGVISEKKSIIPEITEYTQIEPTEKPKVETRQYKDPITGQTVTETTTITPQPTIQIKKTGGEVVEQELGLKPVETKLDPSRFLAGVQQSALNDFVIGPKNIGAIAVGAEQEEYYATPSALLIGGGTEAVVSVAQDVGSAVFDIGRMAAGKEPVAQYRGDAYKILEESGLRASRVAQADPFYALGDIAVQVPSLVIAPVKVVQTAIKGVGVAAKAVKGVTQAGKVAKAVEKGGYTVIEPAKITKTPLSKTFAEEFGQYEAKALQQEDITKFGKLTPERQKSIVESQRGQFEKQVEELQKGPGRARIGEETAEFTQRPTGIPEIRTTRITSEEISPTLQARIKELERTGKQPDLFPEAPQAPRQVTPDDILSPQGFQTTRVELGTGIGRLERGGDDFFGGGIKPSEPPSPPYQYPSEGVFIKGTDIEIPQRGTFREAQQAAEEASKKRIREAGGEPSGYFTTTEVGLGRGAVVKGSKLSETQIEDIAKTLKVPKSKAEELAEKVFDDAIKKGDNTGIDILTSKGQLTQIAKQVEKESTKLKTLEEARAELTKTKSSQKAISSIEDQATQRKLSDLIKQEKVKAKTAGKSVSAEKATQDALRKLIAEEKTKKASKTITEEIDILRTKPRGLAGVAEEAELVLRKPGTKLGISEIGGIATGVAIGSATGLGLSVEEAVKPKGLTEPIFDQKITQVVRDPTIQISREIFGPVSVVREKEGLAEIEQPLYRTDERLVQKPSERITELFYQAPKQTTTKKGISTYQSVFQETTPKLMEQQKVMEESFLRSQFQFPFFPEGGKREPEAEDRAARRFYRVFDVAKTPFGRVEVGLGAQVQSDRPIFEVTEVLPKRKKNIEEEFFSLEF